jgi:hypothetical protein
MSELGQRSPSTVDSPTTVISQEIRVDTTTLTAFANTIRADFDEGVAPVANRVQLSFANGAVVGANNPSVDLQTMLESYDNCLEAMSQQLFAYAKFADLLTSAARTIARQYTTSDQLSGASALAVQAAFTKADTGSDAPLTNPKTGMAL